MGKTRKTTQPYTPKSRFCRQDFKIKKKMKLFILCLLVVAVFGMKGELNEKKMTRRSRALVEAVRDFMREERELRDAEKRIMAIREADAAGNSTTSAPAGNSTAPAGNSTAKRQADAVTTVVA